METLLRLSVFAGRAAMACERLGTTLSWRAAIAVAEPGQMVPVANFSGSLVARV